MNDPSALLSQIWDGTNNTLLVYDAYLDKTAIQIDHPALVYHSWFSDSCYDFEIFPATRGLLKLLNSNKIYGVSRRVDKLYYLGEVIAFEADPLQLSEAMHESSLLQANKELLRCAS